MFVLGEITANASNLKSGTASNKVTDDGKKYYEDM